MSKHGKTEPANPAKGLLIVLLLAESAAIADDLAPRSEISKPAQVMRPAYEDLLTVKFRDHMNARCAAGKLGSVVGADLRSASAVLTAFSATLRPLLDVPPEKLTALEQRAATRSGKAQPDLAGLMLVEAADRDLEALANALNALDVVEFVYFSQVNAPPPCWDISPPTSSYVSQQSYFGPDPGINMTAARGLGNATGAGIRICQSEYAFNTLHEDFCGISIEDNQIIDRNHTWAQHGTATLGETVSLDNAYGCEGLTPDVDITFFPEVNIDGDLRRPTAVANAIDAAGIGDVVILEMQFGPGGAEGPAELDPTIWLLTRLGSDVGITFVAAAGNGNRDLDSTDFDEYRSRGDSGAIVVGAGSADLAHDKLGFSTYGSRVNLQAWGQLVVTLGYGDLATVNDDDNQKYTAVFDGTSSATPIVAGAVVAIQGLAHQLIDHWLSPAEARELLRLTGTPQGAGGHIGPQPDVLAAGRAIPLLPGTWADFASGGPGDGSFLDPYDDVQTALSATPAGGTLTFKPGATDTTLTINRAVWLHAVGGTVRIGQP